MPVLGQPICQRRQLAFDPANLIRFDRRRALVPAFQKFRVAIEQGVDLRIEAIHIGLAADVERCKGPVPQE